LGFRRAKTTFHVTANLLNDIKKLYSWTNKKNTIFVDDTKAFDLLNKTKLISKLKVTIGGRNHLLRIIRNVLAYNYIIIDDNISKWKEMVQTNGVVQVDPPSPLLFSLATAAVIQQIQSEKVPCYMHAGNTTSHRGPKKISGVPE
jgi:hypothetical protein